MSDEHSHREEQGPVGEVMSWTLRDQDDAVELHSTSPGKIIGLLDLTRPGLEAAAEAAQRNDNSACLEHLLEYYRRRHPLPAPPQEQDPAVLEEADKIARHVFHYGPYAEADYGPEMDWEWDPRGDIEWVAWMYRFYWAGPLAAAFRQTRDDRYVRAFVELTRDWISKHPLEQHRKAHCVYTDWKGFAWLDIQTGIRATNLCQAFPSLVHGESFTGEFLAVFLASLYDHQVKTERLPMGQVHNKAIFEQRGFINVAYHFQEFAAARHWLELGFQRAQQSLLEQTTADGVQREWSFGYHLGVLNDAVEIMERMQAVDFPVPAAYRERVRGMFEYVYGIAGPDLGAPMFGDGSRPLRARDDRSTWQLYSVLQQGARLLGEERFRARAELDPDRLPPPAGSAFPEAGLYALRSGWDPAAIQLDLHCSPPGISSHDQPDNGTFELYAFGEWVMPDSGFYTYGHDPEGRAWHRRTRVHQTLTLNGADSAVAGRHLLWHSAPDLEAVTVENASYPGLAHRRTVWFPHRRYFVLLDEALGETEGTLDLHFQFAPGGMVLDPDGRYARTEREGVNVSVLCTASAALELEEEEGWWGWAYGTRQPRPACRFRLAGRAPAWFLTVIVPWEGPSVQPESTEIRFPSAPLASGGVGEERVEVELEEQGARLTLGRDLSRGEVWMRRG